MSLYSRIAKFLALILALAPLSGCAVAPARPVTLTVMAASSLTESFQQIGAQFEAAHPGVLVQFSFAGSQQLAQQLREGAPGDVFASANLKQMDVVVESGRVATGQPKIFAQNRLVVIVPKDNQAGLHVLEDLAGAGLKIVLAAPEVPVGQYSLAFLERAAQQTRLSSSYKDKVLANVVSYEENVRSILTKIGLGEADAGIVYTSDVTGANSQKVAQIAIPDELNVIASYPIAVIQDSAQVELAQQFVEAVLSPSGQAVLARHGLMPAIP